MASAHAGYWEAGMPRYFFHIHDDLLVLDEEGLELADIRRCAARPSPESTP
jgi:hypothetical protein